MFMSTETILLAQLLNIFLSLNVFLTVWHIFSHSDWHIILVVLL